LGYRIYLVEEVCLVGRRKEPRSKSGVGCQLARWPGVYSLSRRASVMYDPSGG